MRPCQYCGAAIANHEETCETCGRRQEPSIGPGRSRLRKRVFLPRLDSEEVRTPKIVVIATLLIAVGLPAIGFLAFGLAGLAGGLFVVAVFLAFAHPAIFGG